MSVTRSLPLVCSRWSHVSTTVRGPGSSPSLRLLRLAHSGGDVDRLDEEKLMLLRTESGDRNCSGDDSGVGVLVEASAPQL